MVDKFYTLLCNDGLKTATFNRDAIDFIFETIAETGVKQARKLFNAVMEESTPIVKPDERLLKELRNATKNDPKHGPRKWVNIVEYSHNYAYCIAAAPESVDKVCAIIEKYGLLPNVWNEEAACQK